MCTTGWGTDGNTARLTAHSAEDAHAWAEAEIREGDEKEERNQASVFKRHLGNWSQREKWGCSGKEMQRRRASGAITSSKNGLFPLLIRVLWVCPQALTLTTGLMLLPGSWRPSMTRTRIWTRQGFTITSSSLQLQPGINGHYSLKTLLEDSGRNVGFGLVLTSSKRVLVVRESTNRDEGNTWKSWGLLARALCLFRLSRTGFRPGFPGWFDEEAVDTPPPWPPPSTTASSSSPSSVPPERQSEQRLYSHAAFCLPWSHSGTHQRPRETYLHQVGQSGLKWRLQAVHTQSASLWLPGIVHVWALNHWFDTTFISLSLIIKYY